MALTDAQLRIYNAASSAAVIGSRQRLADALRFARRLDRNGCGEVDHARFGRVKLSKAIEWHCSHIGWPIRLRPNGRYL